MNYTTVSNAVREKLKI